MTLVLNAEQKVCTQAIDGDFVVVAGPGSGKTTVLISRYLEMITNRHIPSEQILNLTFTASAAKEMVKRVGVNLDYASTVFRTFHSYALDLVKRERAFLPFTATETVIPVYGQDFQLLRDLMKIYPAITTFRSLQDRLAEWKRSNIDPGQAVEEAYNNGVEFWYACAYRDYEKKCREQGWLDFDSLMKEAVKLLETNDEVRIRNQRKYLCVDEAQDTDACQYKLLQLIYGGNIFCVGDENQCQPPGTLVDVLISPRNGQTKSHVKQVPIEQLQTIDRLVSWDPRGKRVRLGTGRKFRRAVRKFDGQLLEIYSNGKRTRVTPNHFFWAKFDTEVLDAQKNNHFTYLMWKKSFGFRIGTSRFRRVCGANQLSHRGYQENANKMWILDVVRSRFEAQTLEEIYSLRFGIPESCFHNRYTHMGKTTAQIRRVFAAANKLGGFELLKEKGLLFEYPLVSWPREKQTKFHGYFKIAAANLIPGLMQLPTEETYRSAKINKIKKIRYVGPVYSLEVKRDHTYVADGIPVGNCIYEWRSAAAGNLTNFSKTFPGAKTLYLGQNFRSTKALTDFFRRILPVDNGIASHMISEREEGTSPTITRFDDDIQEASAVLNEISDLANTAILARTNRQLRVIQKACIARNIKSMILGEKDLWQKPEIKHLLDLTKAKTYSDRPAHEVMAEAMREHNLAYLYQNTGGPYEKPPVENLNDLIGLAAKRGTVAEFLEWLRKLTYACEAAKNPAYAHRDRNPVLTLSTVHQMKGREAKHVYVVGCRQGLMPHKDGEPLEEKRIFFVACSRAADSLHISFYGNRSEYLNDFQKDIKEYDTR